MHVDHAVLISKSTLRDHSFAFIASNSFSNASSICSSLRNTLISVCIFSSAPSGSMASLWGARYQKWSSLVFFKIKINPIWCWELGWYLAYLRVIILLLIIVSLSVEKKTFRNWFSFSRFPKVPDFIKLFFF